MTSVKCPECGSMGLIRTCRHCGKEMCFDCKVSQKHMIVCGQGYARIVWGKPQGSGGAK